MGYVRAPTPNLSQSQKSFFLFEQYGLELFHLFLRSMAPQLLELADSRNKYEDLSGINSSSYANPYDALIEACEDNPVGKPVSWRGFGCYFRSLNSVYFIFLGLAVWSVSHGCWLTFLGFAASSVLNPSEYSQCSAEG